MTFAFDRRNPKRALPLGRGWCQNGRPRDSRGARFRSFAGCWHIARCASPSCPTRRIWRGLKRMDGELKVGRPTWPTCLRKHDGSFSFFRSGDDQRALSASNSHGKHGEWHGASESVANPKCDFTLGDILAFFWDLVFLVSRSLLTFLNAKNF